jgi:hypothetical protein
MLNIQANGSGYQVQDRLLFYAMVSHEKTDERDEESFGCNTSDFKKTFWGV